MQKKDTEKLLAEIKSDDIQKFLDQNQAEFIQPFHIYLNQLLKEKKFKKKRKLFAIRF